MLYWILRWTSCGSNSDTLSLLWASLLCIWPSQGVYRLHMQTHGGPEWINDPSSNRFHTHLNAYQFLILKVHSDFPFPFFDFLFVLFCFDSQVPPLALSVAFHIPILDTDLIPPLAALRVFSFLSSLTPWFLACSLSQIPNTPPSSRSSSCRLFYNWACCSPLAVLTSENGLLPSPFPP